MDLVYVGNSPNPFICRSCNPASATACLSVTAQRMRMFRNRQPAIFDVSANPPTSRMYSVFFYQSLLDSHPKTLRFSNRQTLLFVFNLNFINSRAVRNIYPAITYTPSNILPRMPLRPIEHYGRDVDFTFYRRVQLSRFCLNASLAFRCEVFGELANLRCPLIRLILPFAVPQCNGRKGYRLRGHTAHRNARPLSCHRL